MQRSLAKCGKMLFLGERDVRRALGLKECLEVNQNALISITEQTAFVPSRLGLPYPNNPNKKDSTKSASGTAEDWSLIKPASYYGKDDVTMGLKIVGVRAENPSKGLPLVPATVMLLDSATGIVEATMGGTYLTVARTSAGPALAVRTWQPNAQHLVVIGAGAQGECHVEIMEVALQRSIPRITIVNRSRERAEALKEKILKEREGVVEVVLLADKEAVAAALAEADIVATTTNTTAPLWEDGTILKKGCLITSIGAYTPNMREIPHSAVDRSHVVIDTPEAMVVGDLKHLGSLETTTHPVALAGEALQNPSSIGENTDYIFYKAVGTAIQDVMTAKTVVQQARSLGIGQEIDMD